jgi:hypothetical protein
MRPKDDPFVDMVEHIPTTKRLARFDNLIKKHKEKNKSSPYLVYTPEYLEEASTFNKSPKSPIRSKSRTAYKMSSVHFSNKSSEVASTGGNTALWLQLMPFATGWRENQKNKLVKTNEELQAQILEDSKKCMAKKVSSKNLFENLFSTRTSSSLGKSRPQSDMGTHSRNPSKYRPRTPTSVKC